MHANTNQTVVCTSCDKQFANSHNRRKHLRLVRGNMDTSNTQVSCDECGKKFQNTAYLQQHKRTHEEDESICEDCNRSCKNKLALRIHLRRVHR